MQLVNLGPSSNKDTQLSPIYMMDTYIYIYLYIITYITYIYMYSGCVTMGFNTNSWSTDLNDLGGPHFRTTQTQNIKNVRLQASFSCHHHQLSRLLWRHPGSNESFRSQRCDEASPRSALHSREQSATSYTATAGPEWFCLVHGTMVDSMVDPWRPNNIWQVLRSPYPILFHLLRQQMIRVYSTPPKKIESVAEKCCQDSSLMILFPITSNIPTFHPIY